MKKLIFVMLQLKDSTRVGLCAKTKAPNGNFWVKNSTQTNLKPTQHQAGPPTKDQVCPHLASGMPPPIIGHNST